MEYGMTIQLDKERTLRYGMRAVSMVEKYLGESIISFLSSNDTFIDDKRLLEIEKEVKKAEKLKGTVRDKKMKEIEKQIAIIEEENTALESKKIMNKLDVETSIGILYAGLKHEDKDLTIDKVWDLADKYLNVQDLASVALKALTQSFSDKSDEVKSESKND